MNSWIRLKCSPSREHSLWECETLGVFSLPQACHSVEAKTYRLAGGKMTEKPSLCSSKRSCRAWPPASRTETVTASLPLPPASRTESVTASLPLPQAFVSSPALLLAESLHLGQTTCRPLCCSSRSSQERSRISAPEEGSGTRSVECLRLKSGAGMLPIMEAAGVSGNLLLCSLLIVGLRAAGL